MTIRKSMSFKQLAVGAGLVASVFGFSSGSAFALTLPAVHNCGYPAPLNNLMCYSPSAGVDIYVASQHDDFISYGANILHTLYKDFGYTGLSDWDNLPTFGSGQIVKLFTYNNSQNGGFPDATTGTGDNQQPSADGDLTPKNDTLYQGNWPVGATVTIGDLKAYLGSGITSPVFTFDFINNDPLLVNGYFKVTRADNTFDVFAFDDIFNSNYDAASLVLVQKNLTITWTDAANSNCDDLTDVCTMNVNNSVGGGKPDFFTYATTFNINNWNDSDTVSFFLNMSGLDSGGEELALTNAVAPPGEESVPEPGVLALLGLGLFGLGIARRRKGRANA